MKATGLSPEGLGTMLALGVMKKIRYFDPHAANELVARGCAGRSRGVLQITVAGEGAYREALRWRLRPRGARVGTDLPAERERVRQDRLAQP